MIYLLNIKETSQGKSRHLKSSSSTLSQPKNKTISKRNRNHQIFASQIDFTSNNLPKIAQQKPRSLQQLR
jgi:hypothetical protein